MRVQVVSPAYCEEQGIAAFIHAVHAAATARPEFGPWILTIVDDGSDDRTLEAASAACRGLCGPSFGVRLVRLSRNFGQQAAIQAGLEVAYAASMEGDVFVVLDSDLQHPPELIPEILARLAGGADHVQMIRMDTERVPWFKRVTSDLYYSLFRRITGLDLRRGSADFRGMSRRFLAAYLKLQERGRFNRGLFQWVGFPTVELPYQCADRVAGGTKYTLRRMLKLALDGLLQFSGKPLVVLCSAIVLLSFGICLLYVIHTVWRYLHGHPMVPGWPSVMFFIAFWSGALALTQLLLALYVERIFEEVKGRPVYLIRDIQEQPGPQAEPRADESL